MKMANKIRIGIVGGAGYTGGELLRILIGHPVAEIVFVYSRSHAGNLLSAVHQDLLGETDKVFSDKPGKDIDVLFLCVGHGEATSALQEFPPGERTKVIDLSQDFRLKENAVYANRHFVYGLPELNRELISKADHVANPGCFATAILLGLLPLAQAGLLDEVHTTGITGSTGAGQTLTATSQFSWRENNIQAYKSFTHQHLKEIGESLGQLQPNRNIDIGFIPWRGDFTRGIFVSSQLTCSLELAELNELYRVFYGGHPFVVLSGEPIFLKQAVNTNKCFIQLEKTGTKLVVHSAIDNLLKGASGQSVQNMNLMFGLEETSGLKLKAGYF
jgi:N-acetyl-gamma-glutamyl-phosphate reductase